MTLFWLLNRAVQWTGENSGYILGNRNPGGTLFVCHISHFKQFFEVSQLGLSIVLTFQPTLSVPEKANSAHTKWK